MTESRSSAWLEDRVSTAALSGLVWLPVLGLAMADRWVLHTLVADPRHWVGSIPAPWYGVVFLHCLALVPLVLHSDRSWVRSPSRRRLAYELMAVVAAAVVLGYGLIQLGFASVARLVGNLG